MNDYFYNSNFDTYKVKDMSYMFYKCSHLEKLNLSNFNTSNVINMSNMFNKCFDLNKLDISKFDIKNNINIKYMFTNCQLELQKKIKNQFKNIDNSAFEEDEEDNKVDIIDNYSDKSNLSLGFVSK